MNTIDVPLRLCTECKYYSKKFLLPARLAGCKAPQNGLSPVDGTLKEAFADINRKYDFDCGPEGKWFKGMYRPPVEGTHFTAEFEHSRPASQAADSLRSERDEAVLDSGSAIGGVSGATIAATTTQ